ncbi:hypothetical protein ASPZODRAFT_1033532 [Penicilliopsis zonata CBS 506.65]|uniref:SH3 domain-containing protein n=1 Tax=Penicilliopsis zonata CBS 506.65 TaxID=1073090 RepID=A0A1L9SRH8_9EURO|nr:hypothetical protein ASPZODRAFT_1033532 [Penicilliopsis zonata CBS 506.65]OJJ49815.1 hypothetical protein ASPZODRAFT_1033532 [Penicilliopsis zonata CBS 506.65]
MVDTLDLQNQKSPSAQDHSRQPTQPAPLGTGRPAPHQEKSLQRAEKDSQVEILPGSDDENEEERPDGIDIYDEPDELEADTGENDGRDSQYENENLTTEEGDLADGECDDLMDDDMMDKISSSPSIDDEDIDFEFVYALHNFVATVEGQANAAKGDTMVLLDDSNSYWWLVRVVKDGSIGYLPAEHIETPTERLARLNKHRNIDLSATMLGDNPEKSKNPLKKAMRRRNAKTVTFTSPTYIEASDVEYSSDEELEGHDYFNDDDDEVQEDQDAHESQDENIVVEPLRPKPLREKQTEELETIETQDSDSAGAERTSEEIFESPTEPTVSRSRNGTVRNTDSFFKDDTVETKKISLTPNLLRDEVSSGSLANDAREVKALSHYPVSRSNTDRSFQGRGSFETGEKGLNFNDRLKEDKKRKDKKSGMLSGLFKRKDKKSKTADDETEEPTERLSSDTLVSQPKTSLDSLSQETRNAKSSAPQRQSSKLQKQAPGDKSLSKSDSQPESAVSPIEAVGNTASIPEPNADHSIRRVMSQETDGSSESPRMRTSVDEVLETAAVADRRSLIKTRSSSSSDSKESLTQPTEESSSEMANRPRQDSFEQPALSQPSVASPPERFQPQINLGYQGRGSDSTAPVSPLEPHGPSGLPGLVLDNSSQEERSISPISPPLSPDAANSITKLRGDTPASATSVSARVPSWNDASLRSYLDDENDIRDLFIIVHDKSNVPPAGPDHPISGSLFKEETKRLTEMTGQLDEMLVDWLSRKLQHGRRLNRNSKS